MIEIGERVVVMGTWDTSPEPAGKIVVRIPPCPPRAYGAGWNPTTQACVKALVERVRPGMKVLDLGTGVGLLAIVAAKLGAKVYASESVQVVREFAGECFRINRVSVELKTDHGEFPMVDLCVANIGDTFVQELLGTIKATTILMVEDKSGLVVSVPGVR